ncbi:MAG: M42 family metallopeptidase, partial [Anaerolineales bacterium]|nr:M42 family metallopeptidase [Anaerolineales bacterium]MDW8226304.1 M42 family metallopeptidase [Anaerolineales bacterium]
FLVKLLNTPSPTGLAEPAIALCEQTLKDFPTLSLQRTRKGALLVTMRGDVEEGQRAVTAHVDTLGAMVKEIKPNGRLKLTRIGGFSWNTVEGEGCTVFTRSGRQIRGSILLTKASTHIFGNEVSEVKRDEENLEVRLDARTTSEAETLDLGIQVGDFVAFDPRVEINGGFIRSRHLDDKACVAVILAAIKALTQSNRCPVRTTHFLLSNYEEVGHGAASGIPVDVEELLVLDMAAVGEGQNSDEFHASICVKDSGGPYHHGFSLRLRALADKYQIPYKVDIYPYYGSDGEAWWRAGADAPVALIGPGVDASHNYERTHIEALLATTRWLLAYLLEE